MKTLILLLVVVLTQTFLPDIDINAQVNDDYLIEQNVKPWFGKKHLQKNEKRSVVSEVEPLIWGQEDKIVVMLDVNYQDESCSSSRSVVFILDTGSPSTYISELCLKRIKKDCRAELDVPGKVPIEINGQPILARVSKDFNFDTNIIGMDYLIRNNVQFGMMLNSSNRSKSQLFLRFNRDDPPTKGKAKGKKKTKKGK